MTGTGSRKAPSKCNEAELEAYNKAKKNKEVGADVTKAIAERDFATLAKLAKKEAAAQGDKTYEPARDRFLATGPDPVAPSSGRYAGRAPTKADMLYKVDARVAAKETGAAKGAEWIDGMRKDATFWVKVNRNCPKNKRGRKNLPPGHYARPRGPAPFNRDGRSSTWDPVKGEWIDVAQSKKLKEARRLDQGQAALPPTGGDSSSDDDDEPEAAPKKRKAAPKPKAVPKKLKADAFINDDSESEELEEPEEDEYGVEDDDEEEDEDEDEDAVLPDSSSDDDDSSDDESPVVLTKTTASSRKARMTARKANHA